MDPDELPTEWLRAVLPLAVLSTVADGETYGQAIAQHLKTAGLGTVKGGTLYPVLNRLEDDGLLTSSWREGLGGPGAQVFRHHRNGQRALGPPNPSLARLHRAGHQPAPSGKE